jgi:hypothetical protein
MFSVDLMMRNVYDIPERIGRIIRELQNYWTLLHFCCNRKIPVTIIIESQGSGNLTIGT